MEGWIRFLYLLPFHVGLGKGVGGQIKKVAFFFVFFFFHLFRWGVSYLLIVFVLFTRREIS